MANLLNIIRGNNQPQQQGMADETGKLQQLLRAKSGKALDTSSGGGIASSSLGEQSAVSQANNQLQNQIMPQAQLQSQQQQQQARGAEQQLNQQTQQIGQQRRFDDMRTQLQVDSTLKDLERNKGQIDANQEKANLQQVAQTLRLQNQQYMDNLRREGDRARLNDDISFKQELQKSIFKDNEDLLKKQFGNQSILAANDRDFKKRIGDMELSTAYDAFRSDLANARTAAVAGAISGGAQAGASAYGKRKPSSPSGGSGSAGSSSTSYEESNV